MTTPLHDRTVARYTIFVDTHLDQISFKSPEECQVLKTALECFTREDHLIPDEVAKLPIGMKVEELRTTLFDGDLPLELASGEFTNPLESKDFQDLVYETASLWLKRFQQIPPEELQKKIERNLKTAEASGVAAKRLSEHTSYHQPPKRQAKRMMLVVESLKSHHSETWEGLQPFLPPDKPEFLQGFTKDFLDFLFANFSKIQFYLESGVPLVDFAAYQKELQQLLIAHKDEMRRLCRSQNVPVQAILEMTSPNRERVVKHAEAFHTLLQDHQIDFRNFILISPENADLFFEYASKLLYLIQQKVRFDLLAGTPYKETCKWILLHAERFAILYVDAENEQAREDLFCFPPHFLPTQP